MKKLLLVDDDSFLRDLYSAQFQASNYQVVAVDSGHAALGVLQQSAEFDVLLLDYSMPGMGGIELLAQVLELFPQLTAPKIILSGQSADSDLSVAIEAGAAGQIVKAESIPSEVVQQVADIIGNN